MPQNTLKETSSWKIDVREDPNPFLARIVIADKWDGNPKEARKLLDAIYKKWPKNREVKFLMTCGGFIQFNWPESISREDIGDNKNPKSKAVEVLVEEAKKYANSVLSGGVGEKLREFTEYITLGIDSQKEKISTTQNYISQPHVELVLLIDLRNNKFHCSSSNNLSILEWLLEEFRNGGPRNSPKHLCNTPHAMCT